MRLIFPALFQLVLGALIASSGNVLLGLGLIATALLASYMFATELGLIEVRS
jgi:hypothetical protein